MLQWQPSEVAPMGGPQMNKLEQVFSDDNLMSPTGGKACGGARGPRSDVGEGGIMARGTCTVRSNAS